MPELPEVETVRRMFRLFVHERKHQREIAASLNKEQVSTDLGRRWTAGSVQQVLTNEKYIGNNVFNRASAKLTNKRIVNPPEMWVRAIGAFPAIVDPELFRAARAVLAMRTRQLSDDEMLALLKDLPDYALSSAIKAWYKTGTLGCFCGFERWRATRCNFKRGSARPSLLFFMEQRISAGRR